jgi:alkanesulfonate monooxygenase SsuD/methylene tetrahydromethanopterin reductase-like flavin-dependent oxidoreductase (luciferase family)
VDAIRERHAAGDREGALAAVSDQMVDGIDFVGDAEQVTAAVEAYAAGGVEVPIVFPLPWGPDRRSVIEATLRAAAGAAQS